MQTLLTLPLVLLLLHYPAHQEVQLVQVAQGFLLFLKDLLVLEDLLGQKDQECQHFLVHHLDQEGQEDPASQ